MKKIILALVLVSSLLLANEKANVHSPYLTVGDSANNSAFDSSGFLQTNGNGVAYDDLFTASIISSKATGTAVASDPVVLNFGVHGIVDTMGSRAEYSK